MAIQDLNKTKYSNGADAQDLTDLTTLQQGKILWKLKNLSLTSTSTTVIVPINNGSVTTGYKFVPIIGCNPIIELVAITGTLTTPANISIGNNSTFNNIVASTALASISTLNATQAVPFVANVPTAALSSAIQVKVNTPTVGPTVYIVNIYLLGALTN